MFVEISLTKTMRASMRTCQAPKHSFELLLSATACPAEGKKKLDVPTIWKAYVREYPNIWNFHWSSEKFATSFLGEFSCQTMSNHPWNVTGASSRLDTDMFWTCASIAGNRLAPGWNWRVFFLGFPTAIRCEGTRIVGRTVEREKWLQLWQFHCFNLGYGAPKKTMANSKAPKKHGSTKYICVISDIIQKKNMEYPLLPRFNFL